MKKLLLVAFTIFAGFFISSVFAYPGCTDINSVNYDSLATSDDGSCFLCSSSAPVNCSQTGCNLYSLYWDSVNSTCTDDVLGCTNSDSIDYNSLATIDDGSCSICNQQNLSNCSQTGCTTVTAQWLNNVCSPNQLGCTDPDAENYNPSANVGNNQEFCLYCSANSLENCSNSSDCLSQGGQFVGGICEGGSYSPNTSIEGEISFLPPDPASSYAYPQNVPAGYLETAIQSCVSYNTANVCDSWRWDFEEDFYNFLIKTGWKISLATLFIAFVIIAIYKLYTYIINKLFSRK